MKKTTMNNEIIESNKYDDLINDLWEYFNDNNFYPEDIYSTEDGFVVDIDGDWKHEHITGNILIYRYLEDNNISGVVNIVPVESEDEEESDNYFGHHVVKIQSLDENLQFKNLKESMMYDMKVKRMTESVSTDIETMTEELYRFILDAQGKADKLSRALRSIGDYQNYNSVLADVVLTLSDDILLDTLTDILDKYSKGN